MSEEAKIMGRTCKKMARFYWLVVAAPEDGGRPSRQEGERKRAPQKGMGEELVVSRVRERE